MASLVEQLDVKVRAGAQAMVLSTLERRRVLAALSQFGDENDIPVITWLPATGFSVLFTPYPLSSDKAGWVQAVVNPVYAFDVGASIGAIARNKNFPEEALFVLFDTRELLASPSDSAAIARSLLTDTISACGFGSKPVLFSHPAARIHPDVDPMLEPLHLPMMLGEEIADKIVPDVARGITDGDTGLEGPGGDGLRRRLGEACSGLLVHQAANVLAECVSRHGKFRPEMLEDVRNYRRELINESGVLHVYAGRERFADVGGLAFLKKFLTGLARPRPADAKARPRGVMLTGVQGCGKSLISRALANETGRIAIELNVDALLGGIVGATEANLRRALEIIDTAGPAVVLIDEVDKALSGIGSHGQSDGGVMSRAFGSLLRWSNDHTSDVIVVYTANDVSGLPPEFTRAERLDAVFHVDIPSTQDREVMWKAYIARYGIDTAQRLPNDDDWSGAEIATCTRLASLLDISLVEAAQSVVPVAVTHKEKLEAMRKLAHDRFLDANLGGRYQIGRKAEPPKAYPAAAPAARPIRKAKQDPPVGDPGMN